ncbi:WXG100 family type VII secretion target [Streptacidiphilus sp. N1-12]|uniref:WXG100 family type VII secretion target n=2 Tax=Streptacidiphilus alkalitolerans TaxID=3342712 RepID=A0ABV6WFP4_9ACTN
MTSAETAHWAIGRMFGGTQELRRIAAELAALGAKVERLGKEVTAALGGLHWHGEASDAFVAHARSRARELAGVADDLGDLGRSVEHLADRY